MAKPFQEDSLLLWKMVNASKLLFKTELVLFLNKCDILAAKLKAGTRFKDYVPGYDGTNTTDGVTRCEPFPLVIDCIASDGNNITDPCNPVSCSSASQVPCNTEESFLQSELRVFTYLVKSLSSPRLAGPCFLLPSYSCDRPEVDAENPELQYVVLADSVGWAHLSALPIVQEIVIRAQLASTSLL